MALTLKVSSLKRDPDDFVNGKYKKVILPSDIGEIFHVDSPFELNYGNVNESDIYGEHTFVLTHKSDVTLPEEQKGLDDVKNLGPAPFPTFGFTKIKYPTCNSAFKNVLNMVETSPLQQYIAFKGKVLAANIGELQPGSNQLLHDCKAINDAVFPKLKDSEFYVVPKWYFDGSHISTIVYSFDEKKKLKDLKLYILQLQFRKKATESWPGKRKLSDIDQEINRMEDSFMFCDTCHCEMGYAQHYDCQLCRYNPFCPHCVALQNDYEFYLHETHNTHKCFTLPTPDISKIGIAATCEPFFAGRGCIDSHFHELFVLLGGVLFLWLGDEHTNGNKLCKVYQFYMGPPRDLKIHGMRMHNESSTLNILFEDDRSRLHDCSKIVSFRFKYLILPDEKDDDNAFEWPIKIDLAPADICFTLTTNFQFLRQEDKDAVTTWPPKIPHSLTSLKREKATHLIHAAYGEKVFYPECCLDKVQPYNLPACTVFHNKEVKFGKVKMVPMKYLTPKQTKDGCMYHVPECSKDEQGKLCCGGCKKVKTKCKSYKTCSLKYGRKCSFQNTRKLTIY